MTRSNQDTGGDRRDRVETALVRPSDIGIVAGEQILAGVLAVEQRLVAVQLPAEIQSIDRSGVVGGDDFT
jgi:hypothetical protein